MSRLKPIAALMLAMLSSSLSIQAASAAPASLDELLEQTKSARQREEAANKERESKFLVERNKQAQLTAEARAELTEQQRRSATLSSAGCRSTRPRD